MIESCYLLEEPWSDYRKVHETQLSISAEVEELRLPVERDRGRLLSYGFQGAQLGIAKVSFIEPSVSLLGQYACYAFSVQVYPVILVRTQPGGKIAEALEAEFLMRIVNNCLTVFELYRRHGSLYVCKIASTNISTLVDRTYK